MEQAYQFAHEVFQAYLKMFSWRIWIILFGAYLCAIILNLSSYKGFYRFVAPPNLLFAVGASLFSPALAALEVRFGPTPFLSNEWAKVISKILTTGMLSLILGYGCEQLYSFFRQRYSTATHLVSPVNTSSRPSVSGKATMSGELGRDPTDNKPALQKLFEFGGSYIVLGFLLLMAGGGISAFVMEGFPPALFGTVIFGGAAYAYWRWHQRPRTIVSATAPPIAPITAPASGNMRVQMQRREVVRKQKTGGLSSHTFNTFELICQVQFSETALKTIQHAGLLLYTLYDGPKNLFDGDESPLLVRDLIGKPVTLIRESVPEINDIEAQLRTSLTNLNDHIKSAQQTPMTNTDTFEL